MSQEGSVSRWLDPLRQGDPHAAQQLWQRYFVDLVQLARKRLRQATPRVADEEDVALSALDSFCRGVEQGRFLVAPSPRAGLDDPLRQTRARAHLSDGNSRQRGGHQEIKLVMMLTQGAINQRDGNGLERKTTRLAQRRTNDC